MSYLKKEPTNGLFEKRYFVNSLGLSCILLTTTHGRQLIRVEYLRWVNNKYEQRYDTKSVSKDFFDKWEEVSISKYLEVNRKSNVVKV
jgi:hypothetical protein